MRRLLLAATFAAGLFVVMLGDADARWRRSCGSFGGYSTHVAYNHPVFAASPRWWPWDEEDVVPEPAPDEPQPEPTPEPEPLPPEPEPAPEPAPEPVPDDPIDVNQVIASQLGGYVRANHVRNDVVLDIYQARGRQRIVWEVDDGENWMVAFAKAFYYKSVAGSSNAGIALVCNHPDDPTPPEPEPIPEPEPQPEPPTPEPAPDEPQPDPEPVPDEPLPEPQPEPAPDDGPPPVPDVDTPVEKALYKHGGIELVQAEAACRASGLWLVVLHTHSGEVNRVIYNPQPVAVRGR